MVGLSFHQIVSPLKALSSIWDVTLGRWESGEWMKGIETAKANLQRGCQASPRTRAISSSPGLSLASPIASEASEDHEAHHCCGTTIARLIFPCSPAMDEVDSWDSVTT